MNRQYRSIWNAALGTWVAAPETACEARAGRRRVRNRVASCAVGTAPTWTALAAALFLWLGGAGAVRAQTIDVLGGENKSVPTDYSAGPYDGGSIAKNGTLTVNAGSTLTLNGGFILTNNGTLNINGTVNNAGEIKGTVEGLEASATIRNDSGGKISNTNQFVGANHAVYLKAGGSVFNTGSGSLIQTSGFGKAGVYIDGGVGTVNNRDGASIKGAGSVGAGVFLGHGGVVLNDGVGSSISGKGGGVDIQADLGRVENKGGAVITSDSVYGVQLEAGGTVLNHGSGSTISAGGTLSTGVNFLNFSGTLTNTEGAVINSASKGRLGVNLSQGGSVFNGAGSSIYGSFASVQSSGNTTLTNAGNLFGDVLLAAAAKNEVHLWGGSQIVGALNIGTNTASTLTLEGSGQQLYSAAVSGATTFAGVLTMVGTGRWILDQALNPTSTAIHSGTLVAAHNNALGTGDVAVEAGAALEVASGTTLAVGGNLNFQPGSTYRIQADPTALTSSLIQVAGTATLNGSVLHVGPQNNAATDFQVGQTYTILSAQTLSGQFAQAASQYAYLDAALAYTANDVTLQLQRKTSGGGQVGFADLANTANQVGAAHGIESLGRGNPLFDHIETLPSGAPAAEFNRLSGDSHAGVQGSLVGLGALAPSISQQHLHSNLTAGMNSGAAVAQSDGPLPASAWPSSKALPAWAEVVGHWQRYDGDGNAATLKQRTTGLFLGMDQEVGTSGWRVGGSLGYTNADGKVADRASESDVNSYSAAVYGGKSFGTGTGPRINVLGGLAYTWHDIETTRRVSSLGQTLKADYSAHTAQLFAEVGYAIGQYDQFGFEPFVGVSLGQQRTGSFQERGGFAALSGQSNTDDLASTTLGLRVHSDFQVAGKDARLRATVGWRHAFGDVTAEKTMAFEGGQNFTVAGAPLARNTAVLGLEGEVALSRTAALVLGYRGELGSGQRDHAANVKLRWAF